MTNGEGGLTTLGSSCLPFSLQPVAYSFFPLHHLISFSIERKMDSENSPKSFRLGIDVGGTNTDAVILDATDQVIAKIKSPTTRMSLPV